jgi:nitroreductase
MATHPVEVEQRSDSFDRLLELVSRRADVARLARTPVAEADLVRILDLARFARSSGNAQPWELMLITNPSVKRELNQLYREYDADFVYWMEQQRAPELRLPHLNVSPQEFANWRADPGWADAPALIAIIGDGRRQWGGPWAAHTFGRHQTDLTDALANVTTLLELAAMSIGLAALTRPIRVEDPYKEALGVPDYCTLKCIVAVGYAGAPPSTSVRRELADVVHHDRYEPEKRLTDEQILDWLRELRAQQGGGV